MSTAPRSSTGVSAGGSTPTSPGPDHVVQFTPPGSACSVHFGTNLTSAAPGSAQSLFLIVSDIQAARDELVAARRRGQRGLPLRRPEPRRPRRTGERPAIRTVAATRRSRRSATPTATAGCCRRSRRGCPGASTPPRSRSAPRATSRARFGVRRPPTASTRSAPGQRDANWLSTLPASSTSTTSAPFRRRACLRLSRGRRQPRHNIQLNEFGPVPDSSKNVNPVNPIQS